ncbi:MAG: 50S ribosomal protein L25 [Candidatus Magasanikbacteria bacterium]|nr:50S ribosomal protein L25 [Candidatus Magasanikbacteria bacterium]
MNYSLKVDKREPKNSGELREQGKIPAILYGPEREEAQPVSLDYNVFEKLYDEAGESSLIDLTVEGEKEPVKVLIQDIQYDPVKNDIIHVDFRQIKMGEEMYTTIELEFVNESPAVKELGGTLVKGNDYLNVKCLPKDLVSEIKVDLAVLETFDDTITIADLSIPEGITVTDNPDALIAKVSAPLTEEQLKAMEEETASVEDVEVEEKGKEGEETEEGEEGQESEKSETEGEGEKEEDKKEEK